MSARPSVVCGVDGGAGADQFWVAFGNLADADLANFSSVETLGFYLTPASATIGANAQAAGITAVALSSGGVDNCSNSCGSSSCYSGCSSEYIVYNYK